jgi:hypothetical protein
MRRRQADGSGKRLSGGRRTASPSIRAYSRPERRKFPTRILSAEWLPGIALRRTKRSSMFCVGTVVVVGAKGISVASDTEISYRSISEMRRNDDDYRCNSRL